MATSARRSRSVAAARGAARYRSTAEAADLDRGGFLGAAPLLVGSGASGPAAAASQRRRPVDATAVLALQRTHGNAFVQRMIARQPVPTVQRSFFLHFIVEIPSVLVKLITGDDKAKAQKAFEEARKMGDEARRITLANFVSTKIAALAKNEAADAVSYTPSQVARIRGLLEDLDRLGHKVDSPWFSTETIRVDGGFFSRVVRSDKGMTRPEWFPHHFWPSQQGEFDTLVEQVAIEVEDGEVLRDQGTNLPAQGPIEVDDDMVLRLFFGTESFMHPQVGVRGRPVSTEEDTTASGRLIGHPE